MTEQEKQAHDELVASIKNQVNEIVAEKTKADKETIETLKNKIGELEKKSADSKEEEVIKEVASLSAIVKSITEKPAKEEKQSFKQMIEQSLYAAKEQLSVLKEKKGSDVVIHVKSAANMTTANVTPVGTGGLSMILNDFQPGITPIPRAQPFFLDLMVAVATSGNTISYAEMKNPDGGAGMTGEGSGKTKADFDIVEAKVSVKKITSFIKTSKEALDDIPALAGEINNELITLVKLKADSQALLGDGLSNNLTGVMTVASAFSAGSLANTIDNANEFDVLAAAVNQVITAEVVSGEPAGFMPTAIVIHPTDFTKMKLKKDEYGQYLFPVILPGISQVINVPIVVNPRMTEGEFLVGDFTKANLRVREGITVNVGYDQDDFTKNLVTILAEMRLAVYVKSQHEKAFVTGDFDSAIIALDPALT